MRTGFARLIAIALAGALALAATMAVAASPAPTLPSTSAEKSLPKPPADPAEVPAFVSRLDDRQARAVLLETLGQPKPDGATGTGRPATLRDLIEHTRHAFSQAGRTLVGLAAAVPAVPDAFAAVLRAHGTDAASFPSLLVQCAIALALAAAAEAIIRALLGWFLGKEPERGPVLRSSGRIVIRIAGLAAFAGVGLTAVNIVSDVADLRQALAFTIVGATVLVRVADTAAYLAIAFLLPLGPAARKAPARRALRAAIVALHALAVFAAVIMAEMEAAEVADPQRLAVGLAAWLAVGLLLPVGLGRLSLVAGRPDPEGNMPGEGAGYRWLARHWVGVAGALLTLAWVGTLVAALNSGASAILSGLWTLLVLAYAPAAIALASRALRAVTARRADENRRSPWSTALIRAIRVVGTALAVYLVAQTWNLDVFAMASDRFGEGVVRATLDIAFIVLGAWLAWEFIKALLRSERDDHAGAAPTGEEGFIQPASRIETFLPLVEKFLLVLVLLVAGMTILRRVGVDTAPLLAGAGIAGIAIGFGAQTLVRDIVSGIFFLFDDAFRLGEYVEIDQTRGTVEGISIRSLRIRHHRGAIHTVPFGTIHRLTNYSRDWIILKLEFLLDFDTDLRKVKKIVKEIGKELMDDPEHGQHFLEPVKSQGVRRMEQIGMVVGVKFMAKPGEQFILRREVYQRVRDAFEKNGIAFARPQVVVQVPSGRLTPEEAETVAAAAAEAAGEPPPPAHAQRGKQA